MSEYARYPEYKDSGVPWLGEIPSHWQLKRLRFGIELNPLKSEVKIASDTLVSFVPMDSVKFDKNLELSQEKTLEEVYKGYTYFRNNDIVLAKITPCFENGKSAIASGLTNGIGFGTTELHVLRASDTLEEDYLYYLIKSDFFMKVGESEMLGAGGQKRISEEFIKNFIFTFPSIDEQARIANFLDHELGKIDALIEKQQLLLDKLAEQRSTVITQAVTKGLNPNAEMKDSGVTSLGDIPSHWKIVKNKFILKFSKGLSITKENLIDEGIPCVSYGEVHSRYGFEVIPEKHELKFVPKSYLIDSPNALLKHGDFIFADTSEDVKGSGNFTYLNSQIPTFAGYHTVTAKLIDESEILPRFLAYVFESDSHRNQLRALVKGVKVYSITQAFLKNTFVWIPPKDEQLKIVDFIDKQTTAIDQMTETVNRTIERLKEYRSTLITQAVTGKIDVRNYNNKPKE